jgi:hypothetical protein
MFSGLEIPFEDRPELQPDKIMSVGRPLRDAAPGKRKALVDSLLDSAFMRERRAAAKPQLDELRPHLPEFDGLIVKGEGLERRIVQELQQVRHQLETDLDPADSEEEEDVVESQYDQNGSPARPRTANSTVTRSSKGTSKKQKSAGPRMEFMADKLLFTSAVDVEAKAVLSAKNTGSTVVFYK